MRASSTGRTSATGPATSRPTRRATSGSARAATRSAGMPHFRSNTFEGRFPTAELVFTDERFPGDVELVAFNPFIPLDDRDSSIPVAMFEITFANPTDAADRLHRGRACWATASVRRRGRPAVAPTGGPGSRIVTDEETPDAPDYAELVLATDAADTSRQTHLYRGHWFDALEVYWKDLSAPGPFAERDYGTPRLWPAGMGRNRDSSLVAAHVTVAAGRAPDRALRDRLVRAELPQVLGLARLALPPGVGRRAASGRTGTRTEWTGADAIAAEVLARWDDLRERDRRVPRRALRLDAAGAGPRRRGGQPLASSSRRRRCGSRTARSTAGRAATRLPARCEGSCTHVWNYHRRCPSCFPALERSMREADYSYNHGRRGRHELPPQPAARAPTYATERPCADGQFGNILKLYRDWKPVGRHGLAARAVAVRQASHRVRLEPGQPRPLGSGADRRALGSPAPHPRHGAVRPELLADRLLSRRARGRGARWPTRSATPAFADELRRDPRAWPGVGRSSTCSTASTSSSASTWRTASVLRPFVASERAVGVLGEGVEALYWSAEHQQLKYQLGDGCLIDQVLGPVARRPVRPRRHASIASRSRPALHVDLPPQLHIERLEDIYNPCRVFGLDDESGTIIASWPDPSPQARRAGALRAGDDARHGVRLRPDADGLRHARRRRHGHRGGPRPLRRREAQPLERDRVRLQLRALDGELGGGRRCSPGSTADAAAGRLAFRPTVRDGDRSRSLLVGPAGLRHVRAACRMRRRSTSSAARCALCRLGLPTGGEAPTAVRVDGQPDRVRGPATATSCSNRSTLATGVRVEIDGPGHRRSTAWSTSATFDDRAARDDSRWWRTA